jgi:hypothetical protein
MEGVGKEADVLELLRVRILHGSVGGPGVNRVTQGDGSCVYHVRTCMFRLFSRPSRMIMLSGSPYRDAQKP